MSNNNLSRLEKIKLLQDIETGRKEIKEILPEEIQVWFEVGYDEYPIRLHNTITHTSFL